MGKSRKPRCPNPVRPQIEILRRREIQLNSGRDRRIGRIRVVCNMCNRLLGDLQALHQRRVIDGVAARSKEAAETRGVSTTDPANAPDTADASNAADSSNAPNASDAPLNRHPPPRAEPMEFQLRAKPWRPSGQGRTRPRDAHADSPPL